MVTIVHLKAQYKITHTQNLNNYVKKLGEKTKNILKNNKLKKKGIEKT